jgi:hypothetical protein
MTSPIANMLGLVVASEHPGEDGAGHGVTMWPEDETDTPAAARLSVEVSGCLQRRDV